jgi:hypothetical protein
MRHEVAPPTAVAAVEARLALPRRRSPWALCLRSPFAFPHLGSLPASFALQFS